MTAQEPFHYFARRACGLALLPIHFVALIDHGDFLAEIVGLIRVWGGRVGLGLAGCHAALILRRYRTGGNRVLSHAQIEPR